jgi:hypothetical protein
MNSNWSALLNGSIAIMLLGTGASCAAPAASEAEQGGASGVETREPSDVAVISEALADPQPMFVNCDATKQTKLRSALSTARLIANRAKAAMQNTVTADRPSSTWYTNWFKAYDAGRWATVASNFAKISDGLNIHAYTFTCRPNNDCFGDAGVNPFKPWFVDICDRYFTDLPVAGGDGRGNQAGTLVHETSHFNVVAGTTDRGTSESGCHALATADQAITEANCYEFFAERTLGTGFMIVSDGSGLQWSAGIGATEGSQVILTTGCTTSKLECRWTFRNGMLLNDSDPALAVVASNARVGAKLTVTKLCSPSNQDCTWYMRNGMIKNMKGAGLTVAGAQGAQLGIVGGCSADQPNCTWTLEGMMITSDANPQLAVNAFGGASARNPVVLHIACAATNPDCRWKYTHGMLLSERDNRFAINVASTVQSGAGLQISDPNACQFTNPTCTWTFRDGMFLLDANTALGVNTAGGTARSVRQLLLNSSCVSTSPECTWDFERMTAP